MRRNWYEQETELLKRTQILHEATGSSICCYINIMNYVHEVSQQFSVSLHIGFTGFALNKCACYLGYLHAIVLQGQSLEVKGLKAIWNICLVWTTKTLVVRVISNLMLMAFQNLFLAWKFIGKGIFSQEVKMASCEDEVYVVYGEQCYSILKL